MTTSMSAGKNIPHKSGDPLAGLGGPSMDVSDLNVDNQSHDQDVFDPEESTEMDGDDM